MYPVLFNLTFFSRIPPEPLELQKIYLHIFLSILRSIRAVQGGPRIYGRHFSKQDLQFLHYKAKKGLETMTKVYFNLY